MFSFIYFFLIGLSATSPAYQDNSLIDWDGSKKLCWNDFKAEPEKGHAAAALTSTNIKINCGYENNSAHYHIRCSFDRSKSWGRVKSDYILAHEQAHFDIAEIYARKLNKSLKAYRPNKNNFSKDVHNIYEKTMHEYYEQQQTYDRDTNFSINKIKQQEWLKKVTKELKDLKKYSKYN